MQQYTLLQLICKVYVEAMYIFPYMNWGASIHTVDELTESIINIDREIFIDLLDILADNFVNKKTQIFIIQSFAYSIQAGKLYRAGKRRREKVEGGKKVGGKW